MKDTCGPQLHRLVMRSGRIAVHNRTIDEEVLEALHALTDKDWERLIGDITADIKISRAVIDALPQTKEGFALFRECVGPRLDALNAFCSECGIPSIIQNLKESIIQ